MKKLLMALSVAATAAFASASVTTTEVFEGSSYTAYDENVVAPGINAAYPFTGYGASYCDLEDLDDGETIATRGGSYVDATVQFKRAASAGTLDADAKLGIYANSEGNIVVVDATGEHPTETTVSEDTWYRLAIVPVEGENNAKNFAVYLYGPDEIDLSPIPGTFASRVTGDNSVTSVTFQGSGKLDNFVARTTDPLVTRTTEVVGIGDFATGGEYFTEVSDGAIAAAAAAGLPLTLYGNAALTATLNAGDSFTLIKGGYELTGLGDKYTVNGNTYTRVSAWSDYLGDAVAGAYEIDNLTELKAFQANVGTLPTANLTFKLTADIALDAAWEGIGVKAGKDLVNGDKKDIPAYEAGAFSGTFNGQGHTISSFQMENGTDYGGFFNSVNGATIENLNVSYKENKLCADSSATGGDTGATFVGVARNSTLQYLTALATESVDTVSASKDMAGIVAYLMAGSTVDSCTNELNVASLLTGKARKSGGIALITQEGTGTATIRNCKNSGTVTLANAGGQAGGIVGYVGQSTTIENCENTAAVKMLTHMGNTVTLQGVNKGNATVASYTGNATPGLNFATVDGNVATFVADDALVLDGTVEYKVMNVNAAYAFAAAGTLALDQSLATATVTADTSTLVLSDETVDNVTTYTAVAGVASVGGQAYATMQDAFDAVTAQNNTVTLLSDLTKTVTLNPNESVTITLVPNNHHIATANPFAAANGIALGEMSENGDGTWSMNVINNKASTWTGTAGDELWATASNWSTGAVPGEYTTVTFNDDGRVRIASNYDVVSVAGMVVNAAVTFSETNIDYSKYPAVKICGGNVTGTGKLTLERCGLNGNGGDVTVDCDLAFANDTVAGGSIKDSFIQSGTFTINGDVTGTGYLKVMTGTTFNGDVTLGGNAYAMLSVQAAGTVFNGAVTLGDNGYIEMQTSSHAFGEEATLSGTGRIVCYTVAPSATLRPKLTDANGNWEGTLELKGRNANQLQKYSGDALKPDNFGNANSTVCYNGVTGYYAYGTYGNAYTVSTVKCVEIGELGLSIKYDADTDLYSDRQYVFASALKGSGTMSFATKTGDKYTKYVFTGDADEFTGSINFGALETSQPGVIFKTPTETLPVQTAYGQVIVAAGRVGENVVAAGGTWNAPGGIVVHGDVNVGATAALSMVYGDGKLVYAAKPTTPPTFDSTWAGTCVIGWTHGSNALNLNDYGNANSTVKIAADVTGGYIGNGGSTEADKTYTIAPAIELAANVTLTSGWGTGTKNGYLTTFPMLKGGNDKTLTLWGTGYTTYKTYYKFTALDGFGGTIAINNRAYATIETIKVAQTPAVGAKVANITIAEGGTLEDPSSITVKVGDEVQDVTLEFKADGAEGSGLYVAQPPAPKVAEVVGGEQYETLAEALAAATDGATVKLLANIAVTEMQLVTKSVTLDLNGFAITAGERSAEAATAGDDSILCVVHGGSLTINDSSAGGTGAITGNSVFTSAVKMTKKGDTDDTKKAVLVVNGGTLTGYYYGISGNGLAGRGNTEVTINGGSVYGTCANDCVAIFQPQLGTLTINGGYLEGAMGVYVKSGTATVAINGGTIKGNGTYAAYEYNGNGFNNTGDAFVVDNAGYPGGAPAPSILGGTLVSVNASAIASYAKTGLERIVHFADKDAVTITEAVASAEDVFLEKGFPGGADGKTFNIDTAVQAALAEKIPEGKALTDAVAGTTSGVTYAQAYALGLLDEKTGDVEKDVTPTIEVKNGKVVVSLDATAKAGYTVMLNVYQKTRLTDNWPVEPTTRYELGSADEATGFTLSATGAGFYKVGVTIEDKE